MKYDVFISYGSQEKNTVVKPLCEALQQRGLSVWIDQDKVRLGDNIFDVISKALDDSSFMVVIVNPAFLQSQYAREQLDVLLGRNKKRNVTILPILHIVTIAEIEIVFPTLADISALNTSMGVDVLADEIRTKVLEKLEQVVKEDSEDIGAWKQLGSIYKHLGVLDSATQAYESVLRLVGESDPITHDLANTNLSQIYQVQGKFNQAAELIKQSIHVNEAFNRQPAIASNYHELGQIYEREGKFDKAAELFKKSLQMNEEFVFEEAAALNYVSLSQVHQQQGKLNEAAESLQQALQITQLLDNQEGVASNSHDLGCIYEKQGRYDEAIELFQRSFQINELFGRQDKVDKLSNTINRIRQIIDGTNLGNSVRRSALSPPTFPHAWAAEWGQDQYGLWQALNYKTIRYAFRWIPHGTFMMGSPEDEEGRYGQEDQHLVTLTKGFWLGETTVTQALWQAVMNENPSRFKGEALPVERVSWDDCQKFIEAIRQLHPDLVVRLPWEAEWEYACRAGTTSAFSFGGKENLTTDKVNYSGKWDGWNDKGETKPVKSYVPNDWGLYEMHGNVDEWCQDVWQMQLGTAALTDPQGQAGGELQDAHRVVRGGAWYYWGRGCRSAYRNGFTPVIRDGNIGLRLSLGH